MFGSLDTASTTSLPSHPRGEIFHRFVVAMVAEFAIVDIR